MKYVALSRFVFCFNRLIEVIIWLWMCFYALRKCAQNKSVQQAKSTCHPIQDRKYMFLF